MWIKKNLVHQVGDHTKVILRCTVNQPSRLAGSASCIISWFEPCLDIRYNTEHNTDNDVLKLLLKWTLISTTTLYAPMCTSSLLYSTQSTAVSTMLDLNLNYVTNLQHLYCKMVVVVGGGGLFLMKNIPCVNLYKYFIIWNIPIGVSITWSKKSPITTNILLGICLLNSD